MRNRHNRRSPDSADRPALGRLASALEISQPFDIQTFCRLLAEQRGRPLLLHSVPGISTSETPCGVWIATDQADHVFHEEATSPLHRDHIVLHEVSHMLLGHSSLLDGGPAGALFTEVDSAVITAMLGRTSYGTEDERDAEVLAGLIAHRAGLLDSTTKPMPSGVLQRLDDALSDS